jgi:hypothetical protein
MIARRLILYAPDSAAVAAPPAPAPKPAPAPPKAPLTHVPESMRMPPSALPTAPKSDTPEGADPWADLDKEVTPPKPAEATSPAAPAKPADATPPKPAVKPAEAAKTKSVVEAPAQLREAKARAEQLANEAQARVAELERRVADAELRGKDTEALSQRLAAAEKERDTAQQELRIARYAPSDEVKNAEAQYKRAGDSAKRIIEQLDVTNADGTTSKANWNEFRRLVMNDDRGAAIASLRERFGANADLAINKYLTLKDLEDNMEAVETEDRKGFNERVTKEQATRTMQREGFARMVDKVRTDMSTKNAEFAESPDDEEANAIFKKGRELARMATSEKFNSLTPTEKAVLVANVEMRAAAFPRLQFKYNRAMAQIDALKAENEELRNGTSPPSSRPGGSSEQAAPDPDADLDASAKEWET